MAKPRFDFDHKHLASLRKWYPGKIVSFDNEMGVLHVCDDVSEAYEEAKKEGFPKPYIFDTARNKLIDLGYIPHSPFHDMPEWQSK
jgi:hypothetical protein